MGRKPIFIRPLYENGRDPLVDWQPAKQPDCRVCGMPWNKHRSTDDMCPPSDGSLVDVAYWLKGPQTFYEPVIEKREPVLDENGEWVKKP